MKPSRNCISESALFLLVGVLVLSKLVSCSLPYENNYDVQRRQATNADGDVESPTSPTASAPTPDPLNGTDLVSSPLPSSNDFSGNPPFGNLTTTSSLSSSIFSETESSRPNQPDRTSTVTKVPVITQVTVTHIVTDEFGRSSTSWDIVPTTTMIPSDDPSLAKGGDSGSPSGVTPQQKKIIIGVVVSIVGILSIVGIAGVVWRIWFRRRSGEEEDDVTPGFKITLPPLSMSNMPSGEGSSRSFSGGDRRNKSAYGSMNPSSNF